MDETRYKNIQMKFAELISTALSANWTKDQEDYHYSEMITLILEAQSHLHKFIALEKTKQKEE